MIKIHARLSGDGHLSAIAFLLHIQNIVTNTEYNLDFVYKKNYTKREKQFVKNNFRRYYVMKCPFCSYADSKVVDSRPTLEGEKIRRRRECLKCGKRFTTFEVIESVPLIVVKKDKSRQEFDRKKLLDGLMRACEKRPVSYAKMNEIVDEIEVLLSNSSDREIPSSLIGTYVLEKLREVDEVAYIRFASVYREFSDIDSFMDELQKMKNAKK